MSDPRGVLDAQEVDPVRRTLPVADGPAVKRQAGALLRQYRRELGTVVGLHAVAALAGLAAPFVVGRLVDDITRGTDLATVDRLVGALAVAIVVQTRCV